MIDPTRLLLWLATGAVAFMAWYVWPNIVYACNQLGRGVERLLGGRPDARDRE